MSASKKRIIIVDDEENTRIALTKLLAREGYDVMNAPDGSVALCKMRDNPVDLVIADLNMPVMDGMTFLKELSREHNQSNVIMITAYGGAESYLEALNLGAFEYLNKPIQLDELKRVMKRIFEKEEARIQEASR